MLSTTRACSPTLSVPEPYQIVPTIKDPALVQDYKDLVGHIVRIVPNVIGKTEGILIFVRSVEQFGETDLIFGRFVVPIQDRVTLSPKVFPDGLDGYCLGGDFRTHIKAISHLIGVNMPAGCQLYDPREISHYIEEWRDPPAPAPTTLRLGCATLVAGGLLAIGSAVTGLALSATKLPPLPRETDELTQAKVELVQR